PEDGAHGPGALRNERIVARIAGCKLGDVAAGNRMMVASGNERGSRGRAQRGCVIHAVTKSAISNSLEVGGLDRPTERARCPEAHVVGQNQQNIGCASGSFDAFRKVGRRILYGASDFSLKRRFRRRQYAWGLGGRSAWQRGRRDCRCGYDGTGTEQPTAADLDIAHRRWGSGLLV